MHKQKLDIRAPIIAQLSRGTGIGWLRVAVLAIVDSLTIAAAWYLADLWGTPVGGFSLLWNLDGKPGFLVPIMVITIGILWASGLYGTDDRRRDFFSLIKSLTLAQGVLLIVGYLYEPEAVASRSTFLLAWIFNLLFVFSERLIIHLTIINLRHKGAIRQRISLVGQAPDIEEAQKLIQKTKQYVICDAEDIGLRQEEDWSSLIDKLRLKQVSEVFVCSHLSVKQQVSLYWELKTAGIHLRILPMGLELPIQWSEIKMVNGLPTMRFRSPPIIGGDFWIKRGFDLVAGSLILLATSPILTAIALAIKIDSPGPIFYKQTRIGVKGREFKVWKFRTMVVDAERLQKQLEEMNEMKGGIMFKMKEDPRITKVGRFLRRYSLDELPQIINVLIGEMSLVGPRPFPLRDVERFSEHHHMRHEVLPGITGLWQVSGRSDIIDFEDVFRLDMTYIQNWSVSLDFQILFQTIKVVLGKEGAY
ncbi:sugar transferase [Oxynema sp. CENA135]|uniref:sugar transferase n=1 Tax=Oxynema sp. CENA135 TaxID=984206 RepID=UPI00190A3CEE|nr:sugar transferase [Oxynema sp. CENA135]MBK4731608.1 sugar transferase [Oxynema sp. CENA135]